MGSAANSIGSVSVQIVADTSKANATINSFVGTAQASGEKIASAFSAATIKVSTLQLSVDTLRQKYDQLAQSGVRTAAGQQEMDNVARRLEITQQRLALAMEHVGQAGAHAVSGVQATSGAIRLLEGNGGIRAVENFLAKTLGLGPALQALFPIVGFLAFAEILGRMGKEAYEFFERAINYSRDFQIASNELNNELRTTNAELAVSNDRLEEEIGKLTGHPSNGLKAILDEDILSAEKLDKVLSADLDKIDELLKKQSVSTFGGLITGRAGTTDNEEQFSKADAQAKLEVDRITRTQDALIAGAKIREESATTPAAKKKALDEADTARAEARNQVQGVFVGLVNDTIDALKTADTAQKETDEAAANPAAALEEFAAPQGLSQSAVIQQANTRLEALQNAENKILETYQQGGLQEKRILAQAGNADAEAAKKAAEEWLRVQEEALAFKKSQDAITIAEEQSFWEQRAVKAQAGGAAFADVLRHINTTLGTLNQEAIRKAIEDQKKVEEAYLKAAEDRIKSAAEAEVEVPGGQPEAARLAASQQEEVTAHKRTEAATSEVARQIVTPEVVSPQAALEKAIAAETDAANTERQLHAQTVESGKASNAKNLANLKEFLSAQDAAWEASGRHTAAQAQARYDAIAKAYAGIQSIFDEYTAKSAGQTPKIQEEALKLQDISAKTGADAAEAANAQKKLALQQAYDAAVVHTYQDQINLSDQIAALDADNLKRKLALAEAELATARALGTQIDQQNALLVVQKAREALELQEASARGAHTKQLRDTSLSGQVGAGLSSDVDSAFSKTSKAITDMITQTKNWGQEFHKVLKSIEDEIVNTLVGSALKQLENAGKAVFKGILDDLGKGGGGGIKDELGKVFGKKPPTAASRPPVEAGKVPGPEPNPALATNNTELTTLNATIQRLIDAITKDVTSVASNSADLIPNTNAVTRNTAELAAAVAAKITSATGTPTAGGLPGTAVSYGIDFGEGKIPLGSTENPASSPSSAAPTGGGNSALTSAMQAGTVATTALGALFQMHGQKLDLANILTDANTVATAFNSVQLLLNTFIPKPFGFAGGGDPIPGMPAIVGEKGPELFIPQGRGTIIPADKTKAMLAQINAPRAPVNLQAPSVPSTSFGYAGGSGGAAAVGGGLVTNQNTGRIGDSHYNIYQANNPREVMRQIADFEKRQTGKYSPANS